MKKSKHTPAPPETTTDEAVGRLLSLAGPRPALPAERTARLKAAVRPHWQDAVRANAWWRYLRFAVPLAAAAAVAWGIGLGLVHRTPPPEPDPVAVLETATGPVLRLPGERGAGVSLNVGDVLRAGDRVTSGAARAALRLAGGASLRLDAGTLLELEAPRRVSLERGAVYVDFEGAGPGLEIVTALGTVEEVGTQFEVRLLDGTLRVRVREGGVLLHHPRGSSEGRAGDELTLDPGAPVVHRHVESHGEAWSWALEAAPAFELDGSTLDRFLRWVERETGREVRYATPDLARLAATAIEIHGDIAGVEVEESLDFVLPACGVRHRIEGDAFVIEPLDGR